MAANATTTVPAAGELDALFAREHPRLERQLARLVNTSHENLQDALGFAWCALVRRQESVEAGAAPVWLLTVARHEAFKLDRRSRRTLPIDTEDGEPLELADPSQDARLWDELLDARAAVATARLGSRQGQMLVLKAAGFSYEEIAVATDATTRTVERQLQRARRRLAAARGCQSE